MAGNVMGISSILSIDESNCCDLTLITGGNLPRPPRPPRFLVGSNLLPWYPLDVVPPVFEVVPACWAGTALVSMEMTALLMSYPHTKLGLLQTVYRLPIAESDHGVGTPSGCFWVLASGCV